MPCKTCFSLTFPECPETIQVDAGLDPDTLYQWQITDKFDTIYNGEATTDEDGLLTIDVETNEDLPKGLFMHFSGAFYLRIYEDGELIPFTIDTVEYNCLELLFKSYVPA